MKFIHAADIHLDSPLTGLSSNSGAPVEMQGNIAVAGAIECALIFTDKVSTLSENGAKMVLVPMSNINELHNLPPTVLGETDLPFYGNNRKLMQKVILSE